MGTEADRAAVRASKRDADAHQYGARSRPCGLRRCLGRAPALSDSGWQGDCRHRHISALPLPVPTWLPDYPSGTQFAPRLSDARHIYATDTSTRTDGSTLIAQYTSHMNTMV